mmetsp:Transcript_38948/g.110280  ORF Transcript_38948/g.110280 Transcript_38948/m.110280 type:complete len:271 (+) Transcript_38948:613-1425(+)
MGPLRRKAGPHMGRGALARGTPPQTTPAAASKAGRAARIRTAQSTARQREPRGPSRTAWWWLGSLASPTLASLPLSMPSSGPTRWRCPATPAAPSITRHTTCPPRPSWWCATAPAWCSPGLGWLCPCRPWPGATPLPAARTPTRSCGTWPSVSTPRSTSPSGSTLSTAQTTMRSTATETPLGLRIAAGDCSRHTDCARRCPTAANGGASEGAAWTSSVPPTGYFEPPCGARTVSASPSGHRTRSPMSPLHSAPSSLAPSVDGVCCWHRHL